MQSERLQRYRDSAYNEEIERINADDEFCKRIIAFINDPRITSSCMVDAYYYDFSVIPQKIQEDLQLWRDQYFVFGISDNGDFISKWVERYDLDSDYLIVDGKVTKDLEQVEGRIYTTVMPPEISFAFSKDLLSTPCPNLFKD